MIFLHFKVGDMGNAIHLIYSSLKLSRHYGNVSSSASRLDPISCYRSFQGRKLNWIPQNLGPPRSYKESLILHVRFFSMLSATL